MSATTADLFGLLGYPLGHSLSPRLHQAALAWAGRPGTYVALPVPAERLAGAIAGVRAWRFPGLNVTVPHKQAVIPLLDGLTPLAARVGAVNTLYWEGDRLLGDNTDYLGFLESLPPALLRPGLRVVLLGAGGAARAVAAGLQDRGCSVTVVARRLEAARTLGADLKAGFEAASFADGPRLRKFLTEAELLVNATSVGMDGVSAPLAPDAIACLPEGAFVYDLIYRPARTPLLDQAQARGLGIQNGLEMLLIQAAHAFERWTGERPPLALLREAAATES
ncbi:MAG TPA: shikimate dehydrogenase [Oscillatoriaceae cyanobacterium]